MREFILGSPEHGFLYCVILTTLVYALILPSLTLIPKDLIATDDSEPSRDLQPSAQRRD